MTLKLLKSLFFLLFAHLLIGKPGLNFNFTTIYLTCHFYLNDDLCALRHM